MSKQSYYVDVNYYNYVNSIRNGLSSKKITLLKRTKLVVN